MPYSKQALHICCNTDDEARKCSDFENIHQILAEKPERMN